MKQFVRNVKIIGTGSYLPEKIVTNEMLEQTIDTSSKWIFDNLGVKERRIAASFEKTSDLAANAAYKAIESANLSPMEIDLIIVDNGCNKENIQF